MTLNHYMHWPLLAACKQRKLSFASVWERASELYQGSDKDKCVDAMARAIEEAQQQSSP